MGLLIDHVRYDSLYWSSKSVVSAEGRSNVVGKQRSSKCGGSEGKSQGTSEVGLTLKVIISPMRLTRTRSLDKVSLAIQEPNLVVLWLKFAYGGLQHHPGSLHCLVLLALLLNLLIELVARIVQKIEQCTSCRSCRAAFLEHSVGIPFMCGDAGRDDDGGDFAIFAHGHNSV